MPKGPKLVRTPKAEQPPAALSRLQAKVAVLGMDAPIKLDEIAAFWGVGLTTAEKIVTGLPLANPCGKIRRWRYGTIVAHFNRLAEEATG